MKSLRGFLKGRWQRAARARLIRRLAREPARFSLDRANWERSLRDPTEFYLECLRFFYRQLPEKLRAHRAWFQAGGRGFGEDPFHTMWFLLFREFKPANFLEIGVFRGQTTSLAALLAREGGWNCAVHGISPFTPAGDSVSMYQPGIDYYADTVANFEHFQLQRPSLLRAYSTDPEAVRLIGSQQWCVTYIDGNHDYEIARKDWEACSQAMKPGGVIVLDDSGLNTAYRPPPMATGGHPGPSRLAQEIDRSVFTEILQVGHNRAFQKKD